MPFKKKKILISGTSSGLGKFLNEKISSTKYLRNKNISQYKKIHWDLIIHSGFYSGWNKNKYLDNLKHTNLLSNLDYKKFIFISSAAVYDGTKGDRNERKKIIINKRHSDYAKSKIECEKILKKKKHLIIRLGSIVGKYLRKNNIYKLLNYKNPKLTISQNSVYSFVDYSEILNFIDISSKKDLSGIYNLLRTDFFLIKKVDKILKKKITYGNYTFECTKASNKKIKKFIDLKTNSSIDIILKYKNN